MILIHIISLQSISEKMKIDEDELEYIREDIFGFTAGVRGDNISCFINPEYKYCNYEAVSRSIKLESTVKYGIKTFMLRLKREEGEKVKSVFTGKLGFEDAHYMIYSQVSMRLLMKKGEA